MRTNSPKAIARTLLLVASIGLAVRTASAQQAKSTGSHPAPVPVFQVDANWPKLGNMKLGMLMGLAVDSHDHVWLLHRQSTIAAKDKAQQAPPVVELDTDGNFVQGWG